MRRDALRNQQRILDAAREILAEQGTDATIELIAARAGVGIGTVYRRFPTKDALVDELVRSIMSGLIAGAHRELDDPDGAGLERFLRLISESFAEHRRYAHLLVGRPASTCGADELRRVIAQLLDQAQAQGRIRGDVVLGDVMTLIWAVRGVIEISGAVTSRAWQRHLDLHLTALRPESPPSGLPALADQQVTRIARSQVASGGTGNRRPS